MFIRTLGRGLFFASFAIFRIAFEDGGERRVWAPSTGDRLPTVVVRDSAMRTLRGGCHCENIKVVFETSLAPSALQLRACQCSFCVRHGGITTSDPAGQLRIEICDPEQLLRYRFALGVTDFLICRTCGVYVAATMESDGRVLGVLNVNVFDEREPFARRAEPMNYGTERVEDRAARRATVWMPVEVRP